MHIAFILSSSHRMFGGLETIAENLARGLAARGHRVSLVAGSPRPLRSEHPATTHGVVLPAPDAFSPAAAVVARALRTSTLNAQSLLFFFRFLCSPPARRTLEAADVAVTFFEGEAVLFSRYLACRNVASVYYYSGGVDPRWAMLDRSTRRIAISHAVAVHSAIYHGYYSHGVVWPGVPQEWLARPCAAAAAGEPRRLVFTGRLERVQKRPDHLIACFAALAPEFPTLTLRLVGDGPMRTELQRRARAAGLAGRIVFTGAQPPARVAAELQQADVFLFPSSYESFGISAVEAMAAGVPVVASDLPALREATGGQAVLVPAGDLAAWVEAVRRLLTDPSLRRERSRSGRIWASRLTWERSAALIESHLERARRWLARRAAGARPPSA